MSGSTGVFEWTIVQFPKQQKITKIFMQKLTMILNENVAFRGWQIWPKLEAFGEILSRDWNWEQ